MMRALHTTGAEVFAAAYVWNAVTIGLGEAAACYGLGFILLKHFGRIYTPREYID